MAYMPPPVLTRRQNQPPPPPPPPPPSSGADSRLMRLLMLLLDDSQAQVEGKLTPFPQMYEAYPPEGISRLSEWETLQRYPDEIASGHERRDYFAPLWKDMTPYEREAITQGLDGSGWLDRYPGWIRNRQGR